VIRHGIQSFLVYVRCRYRSIIE